LFSGRKGASLKPQEKTSKSCRYAKNPTEGEPVEGGKRNHTEVGRNRRMEKSGRLPAKVNGKDKVGREQISLEKTAEDLWGVSEAEKKSMVASRKENATRRLEEAEGAKRRA